MIQTYKIFDTYAQNADPNRAAAMQSYMRNQFDFWGITSPQCAEISKEFLKNAKQEKKIDWDFIQSCWTHPKRELQYLAISYLYVLQDHLTPQDLPKIKNLITTKAWWDTIDGLHGRVGKIVQNYPEQKKTIIEWSQDDNFWVRRIAIDHQLGFKDKTDTNLLELTITNNFGTKEFFINKAIGWSLREYSKTNPEFVKEFVQRYNNQMSPLSIREALKVIKRKGW